MRGGLRLELNGELSRGSWGADHIVLDPSSYTAKYKHDSVDSLASCCLIAKYVSCIASPKARTTVAVFKGQLI